MNDTQRITELLGDLRGGDREAWSRLAPIVYEDLRRLAHLRLRDRPLHDPVRTTDLVHESWIRLDRAAGCGIEDRQHFFAIASRAMRGILVDEARRRGREKRGGGRNPVLGAEGAALSEDPSRVDLLALDESLRRLEAEDPDQHEIVMLRYFAGLSIDETASVLDVSPSTVDRHWKFARAWLHRELSR